MRSSCGLECVCSTARKHFGSSAKRSNEFTGKSFLSVLHAYESIFFCEPSIFHADVSLLLCIWCSCWKANRQWVKALINHQLSLVGRIWGKPKILSKGNVGHSSRYDYGRGLNLGGKCKQGRINPAFVRMNLKFWALHVFIYEHISILSLSLEGKCTESDDCC